AARATPGDRLVLSGPGGGYAPDPAADWHLLAGDDSALPAIAAALEAMPRDAVGHAVIEAGTEAARLPLEAPDGVQVTWVLRGDAPAGTTTLLPDAVADLPWRDGRVHVFAHGEREAMKALRRVFAERGVPRGDLSDRKSTRLNSSHVKISYAVFCLKKKTENRLRKDRQHRW